MMSMIRRTKSDYYMYDICPVCGENMETHCGKDPIAMVKWNKCQNAYYERGRGNESTV